MPLIRKTPDAPHAGNTGDIDTRLLSPSADVRWAAVRDAAGKSESATALSQALSRETDTHVREALFTALANIASPESRAALVDALRSDDSNVRTGAMDAFRAAPRLIEASLQQLLEDSDSDVRLLACDLARELTGASAQNLLCALIDKDSQPNVCAAAVEVLAEIGDKDALPSLAGCATRFPDDPFLLFAIEAASERLNADRG